MIKLKCLLCGCINELNAKTCVECEAILGDPTVQSTAPRTTRKTTNY